MVRTREATSFDALINSPHSHRGRWEGPGEEVTTRNYGLHTHCITLFGLNLVDITLQFGGHEFNAENRGNVAVKRHVLREACSDASRIPLSPLASFKPTPSWPKAKSARILRQGSDLLVASNPTTMLQTRMKVAKSGYAGTVRYPRMCRLSRMKRRRRVNASQIKWVTPSSVACFRIHI